MPAWTSDELDTIAAAEELDLASVRRDGALRRPVTMWVVRHGDDLYVRSVYGRGSSWFRGVQVRHEGHIRADGVDKDVLLVETDDVTTRSMPPTARSIADTPRASSAASSVRKREPRRLSSCRVSETIGTAQARPCRSDPVGDLLSVLHRQRTAGTRRVHQLGAVRSIEISAPDPACPFGFTPGD